MKPSLVFGALKEYIHFFETPGIYILGFLAVNLRSYLIWKSGILNKLSTIYSLAQYI